LWKVTVAVDNLVHIGSQRVCPGFPGMSADVHRMSRERGAYSRFCAGQSGGKPLITIFGIISVLGTARMGDDQATVGSGWH
jgi:hypothetical protein